MKATTTKSKLYNPNTPFTLEIPVGEWAETGPAENPKSRLTAHIRINGLDMHLEAIEVTEKMKAGDIYQVPKYTELEDDFNHLVDYSGVAPFATIKIGRRYYCLVATPFCP
jgi:hypothetical protein